MMGKGQEIELLQQIITLCRDNYFELTFLRHSSHHKTYLQTKFQIKMI